ncbi:uncharacterized protein LACBIDRAFT_302109 [Laccaria bicolor S238N-H82]|uniref:Predicted protein n=1 Tax=Laccaria bicolor (strain S238N-H82 / ATCC MYA-4686) TaxID=486041 RepID=B0DH37_LACBS|nr:uncharacterized protein LACBIDRAFT_302109 [Laccaria bicolor S238N-H82]EDR05945.1 predicted protein [Laccaria bicolor S238N-H82]|eukprot:XP_001883233.1 predicted protein [Laccaria bicolor S238N-H82]
MSTKVLQETVTKTLVLKGSVILTDLTDEVVKAEAAVAHGTFSDVWIGNWNDPIERRPRPVSAFVVLCCNVSSRYNSGCHQGPTSSRGTNCSRQAHQATSVKGYCLASLCHRNVSQLFGIVHLSQRVGMVSSWCEHGTLCNYLKHFPCVNRSRLAYHRLWGLKRSQASLFVLSCFPLTLDSEKGNILIDEHVYAIITDFGLSKVIEEMSDIISKGISFFAGSTGWMAPELIMSLVEDDGQISPITTFSDVYAFASVCLEVAAGRLPYPHRTNDRAVAVDIIRGVKPARGARCPV